MWKYCEIYCVSITIYIYIYINLHKYLKGKKKTCSYSATWNCSYYSKLRKKKQLTKPSYSALAHSRTSIIVKILWNLLCQYNNIYTSLHKYLKGKKKNTNRLQEKKKTITIVATVPLGTVVTVQNLGKKKGGSRHQSTVAIVPNFFFSFKYWCKLTFILLYWHNKFHNYWCVNFLQIEIK